MQAAERRPVSIGCCRMPQRGEDHQPALLGSWQCRIILTSCLEIVIVE
ncbi:MAG: hypothetical protein MZV63_24595 [Marinilabiliales bacterium]|nr:hypothetical protein [Marinilabiliales bacterium]